jgi:hypothetical protein
MYSKYKLGDRVVGNKTWAMVPSTVIAIFEVDYFLTKTGYINPTNFWEKFYPDFKEKPVYICRFDKPEKTFTFKEMLEQIKLPLEDREKVEAFDFFLFKIQNLEDVLKLYYDLMTPEFNEVGYPEDDLVKLDDIC